MFLSCVAFLCFLVAIVFLGNRWHKPPLGSLSVCHNGDKGVAGNTISITTWNIGFGALGAKADLFVDGGKSLRALSKAEIQDASDVIATQTATFDSDVIFIQENAQAGFLNRGVNLHSAINNKLSLYSNMFWSDLHTVFIPLPLRIRHGMSSFSSFMCAGCEVLEFPQGPLYYYGFLKKYYGGIVQKLPIEGSQHHWVLINIHLSAFDDGASVRKQQLDVLFAYAEAEYSAGNFVIIGGDWNMRLLPTDFPHKTPEKAQFWVFDFPNEKLPEEWQLAVDGTVPTVRTLHQAYVKGDNYTSVIDGFAVSPNVGVEAVETLDLNFEHTDHHPVSARFIANIV